LAWTDLKNRGIYLQILAAIPEAEFRTLLAGMLSDVERRPSSDSVFQQLHSIIQL
jgi:hypothetical protein